MTERVKISNDRFDVGVFSIVGVFVAMLTALTIWALVDGHRVGVLCRDLGYVAGDRLVNGDVVCYAGERIVEEEEP